MPNGNNMNFINNSVASSYAMPGQFQNPNEVGNIKKIKRFAFKDSPQKYRR